MIFRVTRTRYLKMSDSEPLIRFGFFLGILLAMAAWEWLAPRRPYTVGRPGRWFGNLGLVFVDALAVRLLLPLGAVGVALLAQEWG